MRRASAMMITSSSHSRSANSTFRVNTSRQVFPCRHPEMGCMTFGSSNNKLVLQFHRKIVLSFQDQKNEKNIQLPSCSLQSWKPCSTVRNGVDQQNSTKRWLDVSFFLLLFNVARLSLYGPGAKHETLMYIVAREKQIRPTVCVPLCKKIRISDNALVIKRFDIIEPHVFLLCAPGFGWFVLCEGCLAHRVPSESKRFCSVKFDIIVVSEDILNSYFHSSVLYRGTVDSCLRKLFQWSECLFRNENESFRLLSRGENKVSRPAVQLRQVQQGNGV